MAVELSVNSELSRIADELKALSKLQAEVSRGFEDNAKKASDGIQNASKDGKNSIQGMGDLARRVASNIKDDFKALLSLNAITGSLKLSSAFGSAIKESISLGDTIRKLSTVFDIPEARFRTFQTNLMKGLGAIGLSSEAADNALNGLAETPVRGEANLQGYTNTAGQLASVSGQRGQEGAIAKGLSQAVLARGQNPNDLKAMAAVADDVLRIRKSTGAGAAESLATMNELFSHANQEFQGRLRSGGGVNLASAALRGGKDATSFLEEYLGKDSLSRSALDAQGFKNIISPNGSIDRGNVSGIMQEANRRVPGDAQAGLKTMGLTDEQARGFMRLAKAMEESGDKINGTASQMVDLNTEFQATMGLFEAGTAIVSRFKSAFSAFFVTFEQDLTDLLKFLAKSDVGATTAVGAGTVGSVLLAGKGVSLAKGLLGAGGAVAGAAEGAGAAAAGGGIGLPLLVGAAVGYAGYRNAKNTEDKIMAPIAQATEKKKSDEGLAEEISSRLSEKFNGASFSEKNQRVIIDFNTPALKEVKSGSRGESYGPGL